MVSIMKFIKNLSVRVKIMLPIIALGVLIIILGIASLLNNDSMMDKSTEIAQNHAYSVSLTGDMSYDFASMHRLAFEHCLTQDADRMKALKEEYEAYKSDMDESCQILEEIMGTKTDDYTAFQTDYQEYITAFEEAFNSDDKEKALEIATTTLTDKSAVVSEEIKALLRASKDKIGTAVDAQILEHSNSQKIIFIILVITLIIEILAILVCWLVITKPMLAVNKKLGKIVSGIQSGNGDLTERVPVRCNDEIGKIATGINTFIETLQGIMVQITDGSGKLEHTVNLVDQKVATANDNSNDISSVLEELSATMEEISSTLAGINENAENVDQNVEELSTVSSNLYNYANSMLERAESLEGTAVENKQNTSSIVNEIIAKLQKAIAESKSVDRVNDLTNEILSISGQTNLLALNASIEAARAGEAGRGFAVVADEISQLADSSRVAANNIQTINNMVVIAVNELIESSNAIVEYINENILPDYDGFVNSGKQYNKDAVHVNEIVSQFNEMTGSLKQLISGITGAINGITIAVDESTNGVTSAAINTNNLVKEMGEISEAMEDNKSIAGSLNVQSERFVNL